MADKLRIILSHDDRSAAAIAAPLLQAAVAAALEYDVEIVLCGDARRLAEQDVARQLVIPSGNGKTVYDIILDAHHAGVRFKRLHSVGAASQPLIDVFEDVGDAYLINEIMNDDTVTLNY